MFRRRNAPGQTVTVYLDDAPLTAAPGDSAATVLLLAGGQAYRRTAVSGTGRAPYCMIGNCFDCLVEIDDVPNRQGCLVTVRDGMRLKRQDGKVRVKL